VDVSRLTPDGFLGWNQDEPFFVDQWPRLSPDGRYVAQLFSRHITRILDLGSGQEFTISGAWEAAWSPDSRTLAFARYDGGNRQSLWLADAVTGETTELVPTDKLTFGGRIHNIAWSPDGRQIAFDCCFGDPNPEGIMDGSIKVVTVATGEVVTAGETSGGFAGSPSDFCWDDGLVTTEIEWWMGSCSLNYFTQVLVVVSKDNLQAHWEANFADDGDWQSTRIFVTNRVNDELVWEQTLPLQSFVVLAW
jgi:dipeptidyl aminopeptidase/acylaminoacyl peptidase